MLRRLGIRGKVLATLSVPVLVLFILAGIVSNQAVQDVQTARSTERLLDGLEGANGLVQLVQAERAVTMAALMGDREALHQMAEVRGMTDQALLMSAEAAADIDLSGLDPLIERALTGLQDQTSQLDELRTAVDADRISTRAAFSAYTTVIERVARFPGVVATSLADRRLGSLIQARTDVMLLQEKFVQEQLYGALVYGGLQSGGDAAIFLALFPSTNVALETATLAVEGLGVEDLEVPPLMTGLGQYGSIRAIAAGSILNYVGLGNPQQWQQLSQRQIDAYDEPIATLGTRSYSRASQVATDATRTAAITIALSVLAVVLSIVIAFVIARGIVVPLRRLTAAAGHVKDELPKLVEQVAVPGQGPDLSLARIPVTSKDEVGQLAVAFNQVNATTIEVAQEQAALRASIAEMFVNVARRDQVLLNRQLSFIDALERTEEDPATLADLFRLDHLATRMRRNAESLLVLAGIETGRRLREPLPVSDVIRTASSEIEHYERIQLDLPIDPLMLGHTALPAAHLLAELLENATVFSDPGTPVQVSTGRDEQNMIVTVYDQGLGMTAAELRAANDKIKTTSASDVLGTERLGLFVVGRIASRLGATINLAAGPDGTGTLATVRFPMSLFVAAEQVPITAPNQHAERIESFVAPERAAEVVHDQAHAPALTGVQDVAPGSLGSVENPAEEVDLAALTEGTTGLGLPKRRAPHDTPAPAGSPAGGGSGYRDADDAAAARSIPLAPRAEDLAGAAGFPAAEEESWAPPVIESKPLVARRRSEEPAAETPWVPTPAPDSSSLPTRDAGLPTRAPSTGTGGVASGGLPTREPAAEVAPLGGLPVRGSATPGGLPTRTPAAPVPSPTPAATTPANPQERASMFSGFRSRRAELAAASLGANEPTDGADGVDGAERLAAAASGAAAFFGRARDQVEPGGDDVQFPQGVHGADDEPAIEVPDVTWAATPAPAEEAVEDARTSHGFTSADEPTFADETPTEPAAGEVEPVAPRFDAAEPPAFTGSTPVVGEPLTRRARRGRHAYDPAEQSQAPAWAPAPPADVPTWTPTAPVEHLSSDGPTELAEDTIAVPALADEADVEQTWIVPALADDDEPVVEQETEAEHAWHAEDAPAAVWGAEEAPAPVGHESGAEPVWHNSEAAPAWQAEQTPAPAWPTEQAPEPASEETPEPAWAAQEHATPVWQAEEPAAAAEPAPAWTQVEQPAANAWSAPQGTWAATDSPAPTPPPAPVAAAPSEPAEPKRRWWQLGRKKSEVPAEATASTGFGVPTPAVPSPAAPVAPAVEAAPETPAPFEPLPDAPSAPAQPEPTRTSAWGAPQPGAHAGGAPAFFARREPASAPVPAPDASGAAWGVPSPHTASETPIVPPPAQPAAPEQAAGAAWSGDSGGGSPFDQWAQVKPPGAQAEPVAPPAAPAPQPTSFTPASSGGSRTTFTPQSSGFDDDVTNMLAQRADLAQQALAELSQLSSYRPQTAAGEGSSLVRRTPGTIPAAPEIKISQSERPARDANQVRSLLSSFQSGTVRGRMVADGAPQTAEAGSARFGAEDDPSASEPVGDPDLTQRSTTW